MARMIVILYGSQSLALALRPEGYDINSDSGDQAQHIAMHPQHALP